MGRRKIEIQPIANERNRSVTFLKRKNGLFKKAYELGVLCSVDVAVIVFESRPGHSPKLHQYSSSPDIGRIISKQLEHQGEVDTKYTRDFAGRDLEEEEDDDDPRGFGMGRKSGPAGRGGKRPVEMDPNYIPSSRSAMYPAMQDPDRYSHSSLREAMHAQAQAITTGGVKRPRMDDDVGGPDPSRSHFTSAPPNFYQQVPGMPMGAGSSPGGSYLQFPPPPPGMTYAPGPPTPMYPGAQGSAARMDTSYRMSDMSHGNAGGGNMGGPPRSNSPMIWPTSTGPSGSSATGHPQVSPVNTSPHGSRPSSARLSPGPSAHPPSGGGTSAHKNSGSGTARMTSAIRNQPPPPSATDDISGKKGSHPLHPSDDGPLNGVDRVEENGPPGGGTKK